MARTNKVETLGFIYKDRFCDFDRNYAGVKNNIYIVPLFSAENFRSIQNLELIETAHKKKWNIFNQFGKVNYADDPGHIAGLEYIDDQARLDAVRIPINGEKSSFTCKSQGEENGKTFLSELNVVLESRSVNQSELQYNLLNIRRMPFAIIFQDANDDYRLMADLDYKIKIETEDSTGEGPTGTAAASLKFSLTSKMPPIYYRGLLYYYDTYSIVNEFGDAEEKEGNIIDCSHNYEDYNNNKTS